jgi:tetrapyrrole methylase family protein/MazG family protein
LKPLNESDAHGFNELFGLIKRLRAKDGCPWDQAQTHTSLKAYLVEETYELCDAIDHFDQPSKHSRQSFKQEFIEELGDVFFVLLLQAVIAEDQKEFYIQDVFSDLKAKLIHRHPHVFAGQEAQTEQKARESWEKQKSTEKNKKTLFGGLPQDLSALTRSQRIVDRVTAVGLQNLEEPLVKLKEELQELIDEIDAYSKAQENLKPQIKKNMIHELGDCLFSLVNVAQQFRFEAEDALKIANKRFERRFEFVNMNLQADGFLAKEASRASLEILWDKAKLFEKTKVWGLTGCAAAGKSAVRAILEELKIPCLDADALSRICLEKASIQERVKTRFGTLDRKLLANQVFTDPQAKMDLEAILHPAIEAQYFKAISQLLPQQLIVYEAALLVQTGRHKHLDGLLVVEAPESVRMKRLRDRGLSSERAYQIMQTQGPAEKLASVATTVFDNHGSLDVLRAQVITWVQQQKLTEA